MTVEFVDVVNFEVFGVVSENDGKLVTVTFGNEPIPRSITMWNPSAVAGLSVGDKIKKVTTYQKMRLS